MASPKQSLTLSLLQGSAALTARAWPMMGRLLPERLELDANPSVWAAMAAPYTPRPPLEGTINADLAIIGGGFTGRRRPTMSAGATPSARRAARRRSLWQRGQRAQRRH